MKLASLLKTDAVAPNISKHSRRQTKRDDVGDRVKLNTDLGCRFCQTGNAAVNRVEQQRKANRDRGSIKLSACAHHVRVRPAQQLKTTERRHDGQKAHRNVRGRKRRRN